MEARRLEPVVTLTTAQSGHVGVDMDLTRDAQVQNEEGYETLHFINKESTRYVC
jgi:hypothetical protein